MSTAHTRTVLALYKGCISAAKRLADVSPLGSLSHCSNVLHRVPGVSATQFAETERKLPLDDLFREAFKRNKCATADETAEALSIAFSALIEVRKLRRNCD